jgi:hypothetical protein
LVLFAAVHRHHGFIFTSVVVGHVHGQHGLVCARGGAGVMEGVGGRSHMAAR